MTPTPRLVPDRLHAECLEVLRNVDAELSATGRMSMRIRALIDSLAAAPPAEAPAERGGG